MMHAVVCKRSLHSHATAQIFGPVAQLVRAPPCHGGGRGFEPHPGRFENFIWGLSSAGRASALQAEGHRFEPYRSHFLTIYYGGIAQLARAHGSYPWCRWFKSSSRYLYGILAQLGEHLPYKQRVTGSSPVGPIYAGVAELADAQDLKSCGTNLPYRFDSGRRHSWKPL